MKKLYDITLYTIVAIPSVYLINPKLNIYRIFGTILIVYFLLNISIKKDLNLKNTTNKIVFWAFWLIIYEFFLNIFLHHQPVSEAIFQFLKEFFVILLLIIFEYLRLNYEEKYKQIIVASIIPMLIGFLEMLKRITLSDLLSFIPFIYGPELTKEYLRTTGRITGGYGISIGFALFIGIVFILAFVQLLKTKKRYYLLFLIVSFILILYTQTRSAIYGLIPSIVLAYFIVSKIDFKRVLVVLITTLILLFIFNITELWITSTIPRAKLQLEGNTYIKITSNIYGSYASLKESPFIGIPYYKHYYYIYKGASELGEFIYTSKKYSLEATNHNLFGYYIKFYGLIGFFLLLNIVIKIFHKINLKKDLYIKLFLLSSFIYFLQYSMLHNNRLLLFPLLWVIIAFGEEKAA